MNKNRGAIRTPGPEQGTCWACGMYRWLNSLGYCKECATAGKDSPMISCSGCGDCRRRRHRGEQTFTCRSCREAETAPGLDWSTPYPFTPDDLAAALGLTDEDPSA